MCLYSSFEQRTIETAFIWQNGSSSLKDWLCFWPLTHFQSENINDFIRERTGSAEWSVIAARCNFLPIDSCHIFTRLVKTLRFSARIFFFLLSDEQKRYGTSSSLLSHRCTDRGVSLRNSTNQYVPSDENIIDEIVRPVLAWTSGQMQAERLCAVAAP